MLLDILKALADPVRLRLVALLQQGEFTVSDLTTIFAMGQSRISRHLKILVDAQILTVKKEGTWGYYRLVRDNELFREILPVLVKGCDSLPGHREDLTALAGLLEERRRRSREFFDRHARQWDELVTGIIPMPDYRADLLALIPQSETLLEVGCGTGRLLGSLAQKAERLIAVDHSAAMLEESRKRLETAGIDVEFRLGEMTRLPLRDNEVQAAVFNMVLHHAAQPSEVLAEIARVLSPGGTLICVDFCRHQLEWVREKLDDQWLGFSREELERWLSETGFEDISLRRLAGNENQSGLWLLQARLRALGQS